MKITVETRPYGEVETDALISYVFEEADPVQGRIGELDRKTGGLLRKLAQGGEITGKLLEMTLVHAPAGLKAQRLLLVGAGKSEQYGTPQLRKLAGAALRFLKSRAVKRCAFVVRCFAAGKGRSALPERRASGEGELSRRRRTSRGTW